MASRPLHHGAWKLAAYAVAVAAALGGSTTAPAHEAEAITQIERYCNASWRNAGIGPQEWNDCTQQALVELLERVSQDDLVRTMEDTDSVERQELHRTVWRIVQRWRRRPRVSTLDDSLGQVRTTIDTNAGNDRSWEQVLSASQHCLSERQRQILVLLRDGWKIAEIAQHLQLSPDRISDEKYKALAKLRQAFGVVDTV